MLSFQKQSCWFCSLSPRIDMAADLRCDRRIQPRYGWTLKESGLSTNRYYWGLSTIHYWRSHQGRVPGISIIAVACCSHGRKSSYTRNADHHACGAAWFFMTAVKPHWHHCLQWDQNPTRVNIYIYIYYIGYIYILDIYIYARVCKLIFTPPAWLPVSPLVDLSMVQWWCWPIQLGCFFLTLVLV